MSTVEIPYGERSVRLEIPASNFAGVFQPRQVEPVSYVADLIRQALAHPIAAPRLRDAELSGKSIALVVDDRTRLTPVREILPVVLGELRLAGATDEQISIVLALGTHAAMIPQQIEDKIGPDAAARLRVVNPRYDDERDLVCFGRSESGVEIWINKTYAQADFRLAIGSILPHGATGFSGGAKILYPGVAGRRTVEAFHEAANLDPGNQTGVVESPIRHEIEAFTERVGLDFIVNVISAPQGGLYRAVAGHYKHAHRQGAAYARDVFGVELPQAAEALIVGSHPADLDFWQAGKAMFNAHGVVRDGGSLVVVTPCPEGIPREHAIFPRYVGTGSAELLRAIRAGEVEDRVTAAPSCCLARFRERIRVGVVSDGLSRETVETMKFDPFESAAAAVEGLIARHGLRVQIGVIPAAGEVFAYVRGQDAPAASH